MEATKSFCLLLQRHPCQCREPCPKLDVENDLEGDYGPPFLFFKTFCHHCMYGSNWTKFCQMKQVSALCDGRHAHLPCSFNEAGNSLPVMRLPVLGSSAKQ